MNNPDNIFFDGEIVPEDQAVMSPLSRGIFYGDGCFETLRGYRGRFLHLELHMKRLTAACDYLGLTFPYSYGELRDIICKLLSANSCTDSDCVIRIQVWRRGRGFTDLQNKDLHILIQSSALQHMKEAIKLKTSSLASVPEESLSRRYKLSNFLNYTLSQREAVEENFDQALMLTRQGFVSETSMANIFWIKDDEFFTPSEKADMLPGVTRQIIIRILDEHDLTFHSGEFAKKHLLSADAVFTTNSVQEVAPVSKIDGTRYDTEHKKIHILRELFEHYKSRNLL